MVISFWFFCIVLASGLIVGFLSAVFGVGGGLIFIPMYLALAKKIGLDEHLLYNFAHIHSFISMSIACLPAASKYLLSNKCDKINVSRHFFVLFVFLVICSNILTVSIEEYYLKILFTMILIFVAIMHINHILLSFKFTISDMSSDILVLASGFLSGIVGIGGGVLFVPILGSRKGIVLKKALLASSFLSFLIAITSIICFFALSILSFSFGLKNDILSTPIMLSLATSIGFISFLVSRFLLSFIGRLQDYWLRVGLVTLVVIMGYCTWL